MLDQLTELLESARTLPMSASCVINRDEVLGFVDEVRALLPTELEQARQVLSERAAVVAQGQAEAERVLSRARVEQTRLIEASAVWGRAVVESDRLVAEAQDQAEAMRLQTEDYVDAKLASFEIVLNKTLAAVRRGRTRLSSPTDLDDRGGDGVEYRAEDG
ncbi:MAG: hypothetical protein ACR2K2_01550 [Mycobacteriales bacterium]